MLEQLESDFKSAANSEEAARMSKYMKWRFEFYGIRSPQRKKLCKVFLKELKATDHDEVLAVVRTAWKKKNREFHYFAMEALYQSRNKWNSESLQVMEEQITKNSWWDTVDFVASNSIGSYLKQNPQILERTTRKYNRSENIWLIRTSIIFQLKYKEEQNPELLSEFILRHKDSKEFFIQKASGWALRQYAKYEPSWVMQFVKENKLSSLSTREALKHVI